MTTTPNLLLPLVETGQSQKEVVVNEALLGLEMAMCASDTVEISDIGGAVSSDQMREAVHFMLEVASPGPSSAFTVELPAGITRLIAFSNVAGYTANISVTGGSNSLAVADGETAIAYGDGAELYGLIGGSVTVGSGAFINLTDTPSAYAGQGSKYVRVKDDETGVEFVGSTIGGFVDLTDTPADYSAAARRFVRVNSAGDGVEFSSGELAINAQTGTMYTLALSDAGKLVTLDNASPITVDVPDSGTADFPVGTQILLAQLDDGQVTVQEGATGVTIITPETLMLRKAGAQAALVKIAADTWLLEGNLEAA